MMTSSCFEDGCDRHAMYRSLEKVSTAKRNADLIQYADDNPLRMDLKIHAWKILLAHPLDRETVSFSASVAKPMSDLISHAGMTLPQ